MSKYRKNMSEAERRAYRKRKRFIRKIQVYAEISVISLVIVILAALIVSHFKTGDNKALALSAQEAEEKEELAAEDSTGLKISSTKADVVSADASSEDDSEEDSEPTGTYYAKSNDSTVEIAGDVVSEYAILINNDTKEIVGKRNAYERIVPASMTKVMTVLVAANNITEEQLNEVVPMSHEAVDYSFAGGGSTSGFVEGEEVTVKDLFYGTILPSGGDAAAQLAMYVAGDIDTFVGMMNDEVASLGLTDTHFTNPVGFHSDEHYSTPYDIAIIMMAAMDNEFCRDVLTTKVYDSSPTNVNPQGLTLSNWFLRRIEDKDIAGEILGAKTGYVDESGNCAVSSMTSTSGQEYICCTAKSTSSWRCIYDHVDIYKTYAK